MRNDAQVTRHRAGSVLSLFSRQALFKGWRLLAVVSLALLLGLVQPAAKSAHASDSYYGTLQQQLQSTYGLSNAGTFPIADTESGVLAQAHAVFLNSAQGTTPQTVNVSGQPFTQALQLSVPTLPRKDWYLLERFTNTAAISQNDVVHLVLWVRSIQTQTNQGLIQVKLSSGGTAWGSRSILINSTWTRYDLPMQASNAAAVGNAYLEFFYSYQIQTFQIGGIALLDYGQDASNLGKLPQTPIQLGYPGEDPNAAWRSSANQRIDQYRKANLTVVVKDQQGNVVPNANVAVHMTKQAFQFSTAASDYLGYVNPNATYQDKILNTAGPGTGTGFNMLEEENDLKWQGYENTTTRANVANFIKWAHDHGLAYRGHNLVWPCNLPSDVNQGYQANGLNWLLSTIRNHVTDEASYYGTSINEWDVINEPTQNDCLEYAMQSQGQDYVAEYANWFQLARNALGTGVPLYINDEGVTINSGANMTMHSFYRNLVQSLLKKGAPLDGVGFESHFDSPQTQLTDPTDVYAALNDFASLSPNLQLKVTEFDIKLDTITDPAVRAKLEADYTRDYMTAVFSQPQVTGFQIWDFWDGDSWINYAPIFNQDWSVKSAGQAYMDLVYHQWWTDTSGTSDTNGSYTTRGFKGNYNIVVTANGQSQTATAVLNSDQTVTVTLGGANPMPTPTPNPTPNPTPTPVTGGLPSPWQTQDIGTVGKTGSASYNNGSFTLAGSGTDISNSADAFRFVYQPLTGDGSVIARVNSIDNTDPWAKAGVMMRESLDPGSANALIAITPGNGGTFQRRTSTGGNTVFTQATGAAVPYWVKLTRQGNTITGSISPDGSYWSQIGSDTVTMGATIYVGLAVTSHNNSSLCTGTFDQVSITH